MDLVPKGTWSVSQWSTPHLEDPSLGPPLNRNIMNWSSPPLGRPHLEHPQVKHPHLEDPSFKPQLNTFEPKHNLTGEPFTWSTLNGSAHYLEQLSL